MQAGLSWQAGVTKNFSILTEAYFVKKGGQLKAGNSLDGVGSTLKLYTAEIPVLARIHMGGFCFNAGPYVNYIFSVKTSESSNFFFRKELDCTIAVQRFYFPMVADLPIIDRQG